MWNEALELNSARCLEQNNRIALQPGLELRPEIFDIRSGYHAPALVLLLERRRELSNTGDNVGPGCQRETSDIGMTLRRRRTKLPHRT